MAPDVVIRAVQLPREEGFVLGPWRLGIRRYKPFSAWPREHVTEYKDRVLARLMVEAQTLVAANPSNPDQLYGWICGESNGESACVHGAWVKDIFHGLGIDRALLAALSHGAKTLYFTHRSTALICMIRGMRAVYEPQLATAAIAKGSALWKSPESSSVMDVSLVPRARSSVGATSSPLSPGISAI